MTIDQSLEALSSGMASVKDVVRILAMNVKRCAAYERGYRQNQGRGETAQGGESLERMQQAHNGDEDQPSLP